MPTTQQVLDNTKTLLERARTEGFTTSSGTPLTFSADVLNKTYKAVGIPEYKPPELPFYATSTAPIEEPKNELEDELEDLIKSYAGNAPVNPADTYNTLYGQSGIEENKVLAKGLTNQINELNTQAQVAMQTLESQVGGKDVTTQFLGKQQQEISRQLAIKSLPLQSQLSAIQGNISEAQDKLNTAFKIQSDYNQSLFDYKNNIINKVYEIADKKQQAQLDAKKELQTQAYNEKRDAIKNAQSVANSLLQTQPDLAAKMAAIDWDKPTGQADFASLQAQIKADPMVALELAIKQQQLKTAQKEYNMLGQVDPVEQKKIDEAERAKLATTQGQIEVLEQKKKDIDDILSKKNESALAGRVGTGILSRKPQTKWWNPATWPADIIDQSVGGAAFAGDVKQITSQEFLDKLIDVKAQGATFGALTDREGDALRAAATKINSWEIKDDKGSGIGIWDVDETSFKEELNRIRDLANKAISRKGKTLLDSEEQSLLDNIFNNQDASSFYQ